MHDIQTATIERGNFLMLQTGAQLYTVRSYTQTIEDFTCTIQKIADIGYKAVQLSAVSKQIKPEQIREICDRAGISIVLTHSDPERILHDTDALIKEHDILGCNYIGLGCMPDKYRTKEWLSHFISDFKEPAKKIAAAALLLTLAAGAFPVLAEPPYETYTCAQPPDFGISPRGLCTG